MENNKVENNIVKPDHIIECKNFCNGQWVTGSGATLDVNSPYFGGPVGRCYSANVSQVNEAIEIASEAQVMWEATPIKERTAIMFKVREALLERIDEIANRIGLENGKTIPEAKAEVFKGVEVLEYAISLQNLDQGGKLQVSRGVYCEFRRKSLGVVANITPFNFPAMVPMWTLPIVLTLGNAYVWKPSEKTPLTSILIADIFHGAGLPAGVLTVLQGGAEVVEAIIEHPKVKAVGFVGSTKVAEIVYKAATANGKRALALGGAKNHIVLLPDANRELTGKGISDSFTGCAGQRCMAASVLLAVGEGVSGHIAAIVERAKSQSLGCSMGAIISKAQLEFLNKAIESAVSQGAEILLDGRAPLVEKQYEGGFWLGPTILDKVNPGSEAAVKELFGPILSIVRCKNISQAMEIENENPYGNACSVFTSSGPLAEKVLAQAKAGMLGVNIGVPVPREPFSFGGIGESKFGAGDITGEASLNFWSDLQKVTTKWELQSDENWMS